MSRTMNSQTIINLATLYALHTGRRLSTLGAYVVNDGKFFDRLAAGGSCTMKTAEKVVRYFDSRWPDDLAWPHDIPRLQKSKEAA